MSASTIGTARRKTYGRSLGLLLAAVAAFLSFMPAQAAHAESSEAVTIDFFNDGWFYAHADLWAYDLNGFEKHVWTGTLGHGGHNNLIVPAGTQRVHVIISLDPAGQWIHNEWIDNWWNFGCSHIGEKPTEYIGGTPGNYHEYPLHCKK